MISWASTQKWAGIKLVNFEKELIIRQTLRLLARQRVTKVEDGSFLIENALLRDEARVAALLTCDMRGWAEPARGWGPPDPAELQGPKGYPAVYRLTDAGWAVIQRRHMQAIVGIGLAVIAILAA